MIKEINVETTPVKGGLRGELKVTPLPLDNPPTQ
jgi:hypothetical protein